MVMVVRSLSMARRNTAWILTASSRSRREAAKASRCLDTFSKAERAWIVAISESDVGVGGTVALVANGGTRGFALISRRVGDSGK